MTRPSRSSRVIAPLAAWLLLGMAFAAHAAPTYTVQVTTNADIGTVTSALTGDTVFRIDPTAGAITIVSGSATRSGPGTARAMVSIHCAATAAGDCTKNVNVHIGPVGAPSGRARSLSRLVFTMGTASIAGSPTSPLSPTFVITPIGANQTKTFFVGADFALGGDDSGLPTGVAEADFFAWAAEAPGTPTSGDIGRFTAVIIRSIAITKTSDLVFGRVAKPAAGLGSVTIDPVTGARTTAGAAGLGGPTPTRASFNVTGEGGQAITVTIPASFPMTGPQPMTVTTSSSVSGSPILSASLGSAGSYAFGVGGTAPINSTTLDGDYSGNFTVTVAYN